MKYWAYVNNEILGPYEKEKLFELPVFSPATLICPQTPVGEKTEDWKEASTYPEIAAMLQSGAGLAPKPAADAAAPGPKIQLEPVVSPKTALERPTPVFNSEEPQIKLKSLSPSRVEQAPPRAADTGGINFGVKSLGHGGDAPKAEPPQEPARVSGANFDPLTLSQIGRRADIPDAAKAKAPPPEMFQPAEPPAPAPAPEPAPIPAPVPAPEPVSFAAPEPSNAPPVQAAADPRALNEINSKLEAISRSSVSRQDLAGQIDPLKEKLSQMGEVLSAIKNSQFQREIMDKLHYLESAVSDIKTSLAQSPAPFPAPAPVKSAGFEPAMPPVFGVQPSAAEPPKPEPADAGKGEIVDQGSSAKASKLGGVFKKLFKVVMTIFLLVAVLLVAAIVLKKAGVFDVTKFVPIPFLGPSQDAGTATTAFPPQQLEPQGEPAPQAEPQQATQKAASPDEIIYFARTYAVEKDGVILEKTVFEDAAKRKANFIKAVWSAKELPEGLFEASVAMPMLKGKGQVVYAYQIDYANKTIKAGDDQSKPPLDALALPPAPAKPAPGKPKKGGKVAAPAKPAPKTQVKAAEPAEDEEYEYEEVEEEVVEEEEE